MIQTDATIERAYDAAYDAFQAPILLCTADSAQYDDDAVMDSWLASMDWRELDLILSRLADVDARAFSALEPTA